MYTIYLGGSNTNGAISTQPLKPSPNQDSTSFLKLTCPADNNNYSITLSSTDIPNAFVVGSIAWSLGTTNIGFQRGQIYTSQSNIYNNSITATLTVAGDNDPANPTGVYNATDGAYHGFGPTWPAMTMTAITVVYNQAVFPVPGPSPGRPIRSVFIIINNGIRMAYGTKVGPRLRCSSPLMRPV